MDGSEGLSRARGPHPALGPARAHLRPSCRPAWGGAGCGAWRAGGSGDTGGLRGTGVGHWVSQCRSPSSGLCALKLSPVLPDTLHRPCDPPPPALGAPAALGSVSSHSAQVVFPSMAVAAWPRGPTSPVSALPGLPGPRAVPGEERAFTGHRGPRAARVALQLPFALKPLHPQNRIDPSGQPQGDRLGTLGPRTKCQ